MKRKILFPLLLVFIMIFINAEVMENPDSQNIENDSLITDSMEVFSINLIKSIEVKDVPNDDGSKLEITWTYNDNASDFTGNLLMYRFYTDTILNEDGTVKEIKQEKKKLKEISLENNSYTDEDLNYKNTYQYAIIAVNENRQESDNYTLSNEFSPKPNWFKKNKIILLLFIFIYTGIIIFLIETVKRGKVLFLRKIAGLDALDEAVGRATEMGRPILYVPGISSMSDIATIASLNILGPVAKKVAEYDSKIIVPNRDPIVMTVAREVVKEAYTEAGRPDTYNDNDVFFLTDSQFGYAAAVNGIMVREKPATNLFLGMFFAESLILAETGNTTGAIQIAGTDAVTQLPFFITSCDYTIIGEELYAASAYLSNEPLLMGSIKAQDYMKGFIILCILIFFVLYFINGVTGNKLDFINKLIDIIKFIYNT